jgi:hypothetical protein
MTAVEIDKLLSEARTVKQKLEEAQAVAAKEWDSIQKNVQKLSDDYQVALKKFKDAKAKFDEELQTLG